MPGERIRERSSDLVPAGQEFSGVRSRPPSHDISDCSTADS